MVSIDQLGANNNNYRFSCCVVVLALGGLSTVRMSPSWAITEAGSMAPVTDIPSLKGRVDRFCLGVPVVA